MSDNQNPPPVPPAPPPPAVKQASARALVDLPEHNVKSGQLLTLEAGIVAGLVKAGQADDHRDAVAYAKKLAS